MRTLSVLGAILIVALPLRAQDRDPWKGVKVFPKSPALKLRIESQTVGIFYEIPGRVDYSKGDWLWVQSGSHAGYVKIEEVVTLEDAVSYFTGQIRGNPNGSWAYNSRGIAWREKREYDIAIGDYNEAIRLNPEDWNLYNNRGNAWRNKKDYDRAIADFNEAIRRNPKYTLAFNNRGLAWNNKKDYDRAIVDFNEAIRLDQKFPKAHWNRGNVWSARGEYEKAIQDYNEAIRLDPESAGPHNSRAWLWATCPDAKYRDGQKAVESAKRACGLTDWKDAKNMDTLGAACAEAGDFEEAVKWQNKAIELAGESERTDFRSRLELYKDKRPYRDEPKPSTGSAAGGVNFQGR